MSRHPALLGGMTPRPLWLSACAVGAAAWHAGAAFPQTELGSGRPSPSERITDHAVIGGLLARKLRTLLSFTWPSLLGTSLRSCNAFSHLTEA